MPYDPKIHHRRSIRLADHEYSQPGAYFVTIVVKNHKQLLGKFEKDNLCLYALGRIAEKWWSQISKHFPNIECEHFIVMPNHLHGIIVIQENSSSKNRPLLGNIVAYFKYQSTKEINLVRGTPGIPFWQRNYYEHIIRNEDDYRLIYDYIQNNPLRWSEDSLHPNKP